MLLATPTVHSQIGRGDEWVSGTAPTVSVDSECMEETNV